MSAIRILFITLFFFALLTLPLFSSASTCPTLTRTLSFGSRGQDVTQLQNFLIAQGHLAAGNNTGYFGSLTRAAVRQFQCKENIVCSGDEASTGYGMVGQKTRAAIQKVCSNVAYAQASYYAQNTYYSQATYNTAYSQSSYTASTTTYSQSSYAPLAASCTMTVTPSTIQYNGFAALQWNALNATNSVIDNGIGSMSANGSHFVLNVKQTTTYTMNVSNSTGVSSCSTKLNVIPPYAQASYYSQGSYSSSGGGVGGAGPSSCTYKGTTYQSGTGFDAGDLVVVHYECENGYWYAPSLGTGNEDLCEHAINANAGFGCATSPGQWTYAGVRPSYGKAPLAVKLNMHGWSTCPGSFPISWGDGSSDTLTQVDACRQPTILEATHTYSSPGTYTVTISNPAKGETRTKSVTVTGF